MRRITYIDNSAIPSWGYLGFAVLFALPVIGTIPAILIALFAKNINIKNFARAFCIAYIVCLVLAVAAGVAGYFLGVDFAALIGNITG